MGCIMSSLFKSNNDPKYDFYKKIMNQTKEGNIYKVTNYNKKLDFVNHQLRKRIDTIMDDLISKTIKHIEHSSKNGYDHVYVCTLKETEAPIYISADTESNFIKQIDKLSLEDFVSLGIERKIQLDLVPYSFTNRVSILDGEFPTLTGIMTYIGQHLSPKFNISYSNCRSLDGYPTVKIMISWSD